MKRPWLPFYPGDYLKDTPLLSLEEHGAYLLLICHYWTHTNVPTNVEVLYKLCRCTCDKERSAVEHIADAYFPLLDGVRRNKRLDQELEKASNISDVRRNAVNTRYKNRATNVPTNEGTKAPTNDPTNGLHSQSHNKSASLSKASSPSRNKSSSKFIPPTISEVREYCEGRKSSVDPQFFFDKMEAVGWVLKGGVPVKDWRAVIRTWERYDDNRQQTLLPGQEDRSVTKMRDIAKGVR